MIKEKILNLFLIQMRIYIHIVLKFQKVIGKVQIVKILINMMVIQILIKLLITIEK